MARLIAITFLSILLAGCTVVTPIDRSAALTPTTETSPTAAD